MPLPATTWVFSCKPKTVINNSLLSGRRQLPGKGRGPGERLEQVLDLVFQRPILNIHQAETALGIPYMTAERSIERLTQDGILWEITGKACNRFFQADEIFAVIQKLYRGTEYSLL
jgi:hypothetical protein